MAGMTLPICLREYVSQREWKHVPTLVGLPGVESSFHRVSTTHSAVEMQRFGIGNCKSLPTGFIPMKEKHPYNYLN